MVATRLSGYELEIGCPHCAQLMLVSGTETLLSSDEHARLTADKGAYHLSYALTCSNCNGWTFGKLHILSRAAAVVECGWPGSASLGYAGALPIASESPKDRPEASRTRANGSFVPWEAP